MKKIQKVLYIVIPVAVVLLVCLVLILKKDSIKPEITISGTIAYDGTQSDEELLKNVVANDNKDGDVTDTLVVKSIIILSSGKEAEITYAAKDRSNNVAIKSIVVPYTGTAKPIEKPDEEPTTEDETTTPEEETTTKQKPEETTPVETVSPDAPVLYLTQTTATFKKGADIKWVQYVSDIKDDKDDRSSLYRSIMIENYPDVNTPGEYDTYFYCKDSDGNFSPKVSLHIIITE